MDVIDEAGIGWRAEARLGVFGSGVHELVGEWLPFPEDVDARRILAAMAEDDLRPATMFELVSAKLADPALDHIVALGSCDVNFAGGSASPAIHANQLVMTGILYAYPRGWELLAIRNGEAGLGNVAHNHLLPLEQKRSPKLVFHTAPCEQTFEVVVDGGLALRALAKQAKLRNLSDAVDQFPPPPPGKRTRTMTVLAFNRQVTTAEVIAELGARGLRVATAHELVSFIAAHQAAVKDRSIWALGESRPAGGWIEDRGTLAVHHGMSDDKRWGFHEAFLGVDAS